MKKVLLGMALLSSVALAEGNYNVYGKLGVDLHSKFSNTSEIDEEGLEFGLGFPKKSLGLGVFVEATKNITPKIELGLGLGYINRKDKTVTQRSGIGHAGTVITNEDFDTFKAPVYESVPVYVTGKYNLDMVGNIKPYLKAALGYSFNFMKKNITVKETEYTAGAVTGTSEYTAKLKAKDGLYVGMGVGAEYNNFLMELSYIQTNAKVKYEDAESNFSQKYNNNAVRLMMGYKFNF